MTAARVIASVEPTSTCKYCHSPILWQDRRPLNADHTPHDFACCKAIRKQAKLTWSRHVAEHHRREAVALIRENARVVVERGFKQPDNPHARRNQPIVTELLEGVAKVGWHVVYVATLASGHRCKVQFHQGGIGGGRYARRTHSSCVVEPYSKTKKDLAAFNAALAEVNL